jgi:hypothetical protein
MIVRTSQPGVALYTRRLASEALGCAGIDTRSAALSASVTYAGCVLSVLQYPPPPRRAPRRLKQ